MRNRIDGAMQKCMIGGVNPSAAIQHLIAAGLTEIEIGQRVGAHQSTINRIKRGQAPTWEVGAALVRLAEATPVPPSEQGREAA